MGSCCSCCDSTDELPKNTFTKYVSKIVYTTQGELVEISYPLKKENVKTEGNVDWDNVAVYKLDLNNKRTGQIPNSIVDIKGLFKNINNEHEKKRLEQINREMGERERKMTELKKGLKPDLNASKPFGYYPEPKGANV